MSKIVKALQRYQFSLVRVFTSLYLIYFFTGMIEQSELIKDLIGSPSDTLRLFILILPILSLILCVFLLLGIFVNFASLGLVILYQMGFIFLPIPKEVQVSYLSMVLLIFALFSKRNKGIAFLNTQLIDVSFWRLALFLVVYFGFSVSGLSKVFYKPWLNGEAVNYFCTTSQIGNMVGTLICSFLPKALLGYIVLFVEIASFPLAVFNRTRAIAWILNTLLHIFIPIFLYVWPVSFGVLLMQFVLFDFRWFKNIQPSMQPKNLRS